jgi:hypothetical protein
VLTAIGMVLALVALGRPRTTQDEPAGLDLRLAALKRLAEQGGAAGAT